MSRNWLWLLGVGGLWALSVTLLHGNFQHRLSSLQTQLRRSRLDSDPGSYHRDEGRRNVDWDSALILYNRIPKTGSTSFANGVLYDLAAPNGFHCLHLNVSRNAHTMTLPDQLRFAENVTSWKTRLPAVYHGHVAFIDFTLFGIRQPIYINIVREPLDRFLTYYYFLRYGDNYRPHLSRKRMGDTETFDECVARDGRDCQAESMWLQIPFFCGHHPACWEPGNEWALQQAKTNLATRYLLVGLTEALPDFVLLLQETLPRFFADAHRRFMKGEKSHLRKTNKKLKPRPETIAKMKASKVYQMESEFYAFAKSTFTFHKERLLDTHGRPRKQEFHYEKVKPRLDF